MTYSQLVSTIKQGRFLPVYLLVGEEFQREEALSLLISNLVDPATRDFNLDIFHAGEVQPNTLINVVLSFPMMAQRRAVVLKECDKFPTGTLEELLRVASDPAFPTSLILTAEKVDFNARPFRRLKKNGCVVEFKPLYDDQIPDWVQSRVRQKGKQISEDAVDLLHTSVGTDLRSLANEIDKLSIFVEEGPCITKDDVESVVGISKTNSIFELINAIGGRHRDKALFILDRMLEAGESAAGIITMITRHLKAMLRAKELGKLHLSRDELSKRTGVRPYFLNALLGQAGTFPNRQIKQGLDALLEADNNLKRGHQNQRIVMELLIYSLTR